MRTFHFYTITHRGKRYSAICPFYHWSKVVAYFGVTRNDLKRGSNAGDPPWEFA